MWREHGILTEGMPVSARLVLSYLTSVTDRCIQSSLRWGNSDPLHNTHNLYIDRCSPSNKPPTLPNQALINGHKTNNRARPARIGKHLRRGTRASWKSSSERYIPPLCQAPNHSLSNICIGQSSRKVSRFGRLFLSDGPTVRHSEFLPQSMTDIHRRADNPILFASDGFVAVTGYSRRDIIPRNCRFLQGELTDSRSTKRLRASIDCCEETVELLLNYRKNGDPFWNLLYVSPLLNERGEVVFFLGGQINCSTTIHSFTDILKVLSINDEELESEEVVKNKSPSVRSQESKSKPAKSRNNFFKSFRKYNPPPPQTKLSVRDEAGMEPELLNRLGKLSFKTQVEAFYTAYSKYLVLSFNPQTQHLTIEYYSPGIIDMLCLNLPNGSVAPIFHKEIFRILAEHSPLSSSVAKTFKTMVRDAIKKGEAVSVETELLTGYEERKERTGFGRMLGERGDGGLVRVEERYVTHWTPLKDEEGRPRWVVLTIAPNV